MLCFQAITQLSSEPRVMSATSFTGTKREDPGNEFYDLARCRQVTKIAAAPPQAPFVFVDAKNRG